MVLARTELQQLAEIRIDEAGALTRRASGTGHTTWLVTPWNAH